MKRALLLPLLFIASCADSSEEYEDCTYADDPALASGSRGSKCAPSTFPAEDVHSREISGIVWRGPDPVPGALVRIEPWADFVTTRSAPIVTTVTDNVGVFANLRPIALRYDVSAKLGDDVVVIRGVAGRHIEPSLEISTPKLPDAWTSQINVTVDVPIPADHVVAFFANGDSVLSAVGELAGGGQQQATFSLVSKKFTGAGTIHAIEYVKGKLLESAVRYAKADVIYSSNAPRFAPLQMTAITGTATPTVVIAKMPPGFPAPRAVDVIAGYAGQSAGLLTTLVPGVPKQLPLLPNAIYTYRARATAPDGAVSDTGEMSLDAFAVTMIELPAPPTLESPDTIRATDPLRATGAGVLEHVLVPDAAPSATIRIIVQQQEARLPDLAAMGAATPMRGSFTWTTRSYQGLRFVDELSGPDARRYHSAGTSAPRKLTIQ